MSERGSTGGSRRRFVELLNQALEEPLRREEIVREIERDFTQERAVLVADLDSFTASTVEHGIIAFLILLQQVQRLTQPVLRRHGGLPLKSEADTLFCLFDHVEPALHAAIEIRECLEGAGLQVANSGTPVTVAMGLGYGRILNVGDEDALGAEVNFAYKLGEDIGRGGDILLTAAARERVEDPRYRFDSRSALISGLQLPYHALT